MGAAAPGSIGGQAQLVCAPKPMCVKEGTHKCWWAEDATGRFWERTGWTHCPRDGDDGNVCFTFFMSLSWVWSLGLASWRGGPVCGGGQC